MLPFGEFGAFGYYFAELLFVEDQVVGGGDDHRCVGIDASEPPCGVGDAGGRIASDRFAEYLMRFQLGQVFEYQRFVDAVGRYEEVLRRDDLGEAFVSMADETFAGAEDIEELFGLRAAADRPETAADASRHDNAVAVLIHVAGIKVVLFYNDTSFFRDTQAFGAGAEEPSARIFIILPGNGPGVHKRRNGTVCAENRALAVRPV